MRLLKDLANEDDWALDDVAIAAASGRRRRSLLAETAAEAAEAEARMAAGGPGAASEFITWGGSAGATGLDLEEQEAVLSRYFRPHEVKRYMQVQREVDANNAAMRVRTWAPRRGRRAVCLRAACPTQPLTLGFGNPCLRRLFARAAAAALRTARSCVPAL